MNNECMYFAVCLVSETMHWSDKSGLTDDIEITAYGLLALMKFDDFTSAAKVVTWLTSNRNAAGTLYTTQVIQYNINGIDVQSKHAVNNVESSLWAQ